VRPLLLFVTLWGLACRAERPQRAAVERVDASEQIPIERIRPSCDSRQPCGTWVVFTPAHSRGDSVLRFAGSYLTVADRVVVWLDTVAGRGSQNPHWTPADSVWASLRPQERLERSCGLRGQPLDGRVVAVVRDISLQEYERPRLAWRFDLDSVRIRAEAIDSVYCERERAGE